jgi:Ca-activated chloride channel family protein
VTERGEPLLATWRYGLGQAAAFTSDAKARWGSEWLNWPGYGKFWAQVVRGIMRKTDRATFAVTTRESPDKLEIRVDAIKPDGSFRNQLPITVTALQADGTSHSTQAHQDAPGSYSATLPIPSEGTTIFSLTSPDLPDAGTTFGHTRSYPREFLHTETNEPLLRRIAQLGRGTFNPKPEAVWTPAAIATPQRKDFTDYFLIAALALIPLDIWLRRRA